MSAKVSRKPKKDELKRLKVQFQWWTVTDSGPSCSSIVNCTTGLSKAGLDEHVKKFATFFAEQGEGSNYTRAYKFLHGIFEFRFQESLGEIARPAKFKDKDIDVIVGLVS